MTMYFLNKIKCLSLFICILAISCGKGENTPAPVPVNSDPVIFSIAPLSGGVGTTVIIKGDNFSTNILSNIVKFNGVIATISVAKEDTLIVTVPVGASNGAITITVNNRTVNGSSFTVLTNLTVSTLAGTGVQAVLNGNASAAQFNFPYDICLDAQGNIYVSDYNQIRKITPAGIVNTLAGSGIRGFLDGPGNIAQFNPVMGIACDGQGNIYAADRDNNKIRKITADGTVSTLAGGSTFGYQNGTGTDARFWEPISVAVDAQGNVYVADKSNFRIRKITPSGTVSTLAGKGTSGYSDGISSLAEFYNLQDIAVDNQGVVYVTDQNRIRKITSDGTVTTFAGSGANNFLNAIGIMAEFANPNGICIDGAGNIFIGDVTNAVIRKISTTAVVTTYAGSPGQQGFADGLFNTAKFYYPKGVAVDIQGNIYIADNANHRIRKVSFQ